MGVGVSTLHVYIYSSGKQGVLQYMHVLFQVGVHKVAYRDIILSASTCMQFALQYFRISHENIN